MTPADLDALVARLQGFNPPDRTIAPQRDFSQAIHEAAAALAQLRDENARLKDRIEAQFKRLTSMDGLLANAEARIAALEAENARLTVEFRKVEVLWKEAAIDASRKHDTIGGLENACRISLYRADALQAENRLLRECARTPDLERIDAAIDAAKVKP